MYSRNIFCALFIFVVFFNVSCSHKQEQKDFESKKVTVKNDKWDKKKFVLDDFLLLEDNKESHFIELKKLKIKNEKAYILDTYNQHKLFVFNMDGSFVNAILLSQEEGEEKNKIWDFDVNDKGEVGLLDAERNKLFFYTEDGVLVKKMDLLFKVDAFAFLKNEGCVFSVKKDGGLDNKPKVVVTDANLNIEKEYFSYTEKSKDNKLSKFLFRDSPQGIVYNKAVDDFLVVFDEINGDVIKTYRVDFGDKEMPQNFKDDFEAYIGSYDEINKHYCMYQTPCLVSNTIVGGLFVGVKNGLFAYDLNTKKSFVKTLKMAALSCRELKTLDYVLNDSTVVSHLDLRFYTNVRNKNKLDSVTKAHVKKGGNALSFFKIKTNE